jgi:branched-chain amino acid transport system substrate-binding protein
MILADDGNDPVRTQAIVRRMVEQDKVIAFFSEYTMGSLSSVLPYLEEKNIPLIGCAGAVERCDHSPMVFHPLMGADVGASWAWLLTTAAQTDKRKLGFIYCREVTQCKNQLDKMKENLPWNGFQLVYEAQVALAQPDFTAEAIQARQSGAEVILFATDAASVVRFARSAHRQDYRPTLGAVHNINNSSLLEGGQDIEGTLTTSRSAVWQTSPNMKFYRDAISRYQPGAPMGGMGSDVFVFGKLLEEKIAPFLEEQPRTDQIIEGLYSLDKETLGGLLPGVTFNRGAHVNVNLCILPTRVSGNKFVAHDPAETFVCAPGWKPQERAG